jgi:hypothetical protein
MTAEYHNEIIEGDYEADHLICQPYNAGIPPCFVADKLGLSTGKIANHLSTMERYGLVKRQKNGQWTMSYCGVTLDNPRGCKNHKFSEFSRRCRSCANRMFVKPEVPR